MDSDEHVRDDIAQLRREVAELTDAVRSLARTCGRMDDHITFVNRTYDAVRSPLSWLIGYINRCKDVPELPPCPVDRVQEHAAPQEDVVQ